MSYSTGRATTPSTGGLQNDNIDGRSTYDDMVTAGYFGIVTGIFLTAISTDSATLLDTQVYFDADSLGGTDGVLIATLEDAVTASGDFLV